MWGIADQVVWCGGHVMLVRWWGVGYSRSSGLVWGPCHAGQVVGCGV